LPSILLRNHWWREIVE